MLFMFFINYLIHDCKNKYIQAKYISLIQDKHAWLAQNISLFQL